MLTSRHPHSPSNDASIAPAHRTLAIGAGKARLQGDLALPRRALGIVVFAPGSSSGRHDPREQRVARTLRQHGLGTLLFDPLTPAERRQDATDERLRFDVGLLGRRLALVTDWVAAQEPTRTLPIAYIGSGMGAAVAIAAAAARPALVHAVVSRAGRPDLAGSALTRLQAPTLLLVRNDDQTSRALNELAQRQMPHARILLVQDASPAFDAPGSLDTCCQLAADWLATRLPRPPRA